MNDLPNPNSERFRIGPSEESVEGCLGASSAGQGEVTPSALAPTQPLDLIADLRELSAGHHSQANVLVWNVSLSALIARVEQLDGEHDEWRSEIGRLTRERDEWESNATEESARAEAAEAAVARVRDHHAKVDWRPGHPRPPHAERGVCDWCGVSFPCLTVLALDGTA